MYKIICLTVVLLFGSLVYGGEEMLSFPDEHAAPVTKQRRIAIQRDLRFEVFQLAFWYNFPRYTWDSSVYGLKVGFPFSAGIGKVKGLELALFGAATDHINGTQLAFGYCHAKELLGLQLSMVNIFGLGPESWQVGLVNSADDASVQLGIFNYAVTGSCQFGLINIITNGPVPFTIFFNYADTAPKGPYAGRK